MSIEPAESLDSSDDRKGNKQKAAEARKTYKEQKFATSEAAKDFLKKLPTSTRNVVGEFGRAVRAIERIG